LQEIDIKNLGNKFLQQNIGKIRGSVATSNEAGVFTILALNHRQSFAGMLTSTARDGIFPGNENVASLGWLYSCSGLS
jgi:hypothetical protein